MTDIIIPDILQEKIISWLNSFYPSCPDARDYFRTFPDVNIREMIESVTILVEAGIVDAAVYNPKSVNAMKFMEIIKTCFKKADIKSHIKMLEIPYS